MKKNIKLNLAFCETVSEKFVVLTSKKELLDTYLVSMQSSSLVHKVSVQESTVRTSKENDIHSMLCNMDVLNSLITVKNIHNWQQLYIWLKIKAGTYIPTEDWDKFLDENSLLNDWIDGKISIKTVHCYNEKSKEFGYKKNIKKIVTHLKDTELWNFPQLFKGDTQKIEGNYAKYAYTIEFKMVEVVREGKIFLLNQDWLEKIEPSLQTYCLY